MKTQTIAAIVLIIAGGLALAYGGFSYTKDSHGADIGGLHLSLDEKQYISVPVWAGIGALVVGGLMLARRYL